MNYKSITDKKKSLNNSSKNDKILEIKHNLFKELSNNGSRTIRYRDKKEKINFINNNINIYKIKNKEESKIQENEIDNQIFYQNNNNVINRNQNELFLNKNYDSKSKFQSNRNKTLSLIKSNSINNNNFEDENDLMYIISKDTTKNYPNKYSLNKYNDNNIISCLALPFCNYHKFNIKLPKRYTCNFKNCACCQLKENQPIFNENTKESSRDYIYPSIDKTISSNKKYNNVLEKFISKNKKKPKEKNKKKKYIKKKVDDNFNIKTKKNNLNKININLKKANYEERKNSNSQSKKPSMNSSKSEEMSNISLNFQKPDETNVKIPKKNLEELSESSNKSLSKSFSLDVPDDININDENDLKQYKNLVNKKNKESKIHFSVKYYQKLNKSFRIYCDENNKKKSSPFKPKSKEKRFEFLRYN